MKFDFDDFHVCLKYYDFYAFIISLLIIIFNLIIFFTPRLFFSYSVVLKSKLKAYFKDFQFRGLSLIILAIFI